MNDIEDVTMISSAWEEGDKYQVTTIIPCTRQILEEPKAKEFIKERLLLARNEKIRQHHPECMSLQWSNEFWLGSPFLSLATMRDRQPVKLDW